MDVAALRLFVMPVAGWWADQRHETVAYLVEENRILRAHLRGRIRLTDEERRRLAVHGHRLGRCRLGQVATIVMPDTILRIASSSRPRITVPLRPAISQIDASSGAAGADVAARAVQEPPQQFDRDQKTLSVYVEIHRVRPQIRVAAAGKRKRVE